MVRKALVAGLLLVSVGLAQAEEKKPSYKEPKLPKGEDAKLRGNADVPGLYYDVVSEVDGARVGMDRAGLIAVSLAPGRHTVLLRPSWRGYGTLYWKFADPATFVAAPGHRYLSMPHVFVNGAQLILGPQVERQRAKAFEAAAPGDAELRHVLGPYKQEDWGAVLVHHEISDEDDGLCVPGHDGDGPLKYWEKRVTDHPESTADRFHRGESYMSAGKYELAIADFDRVLVLDPTFARAAQARSRARYHQNQDDLALKDLDAAAAISPNLAVTHLFRGHVLWRKGNLDGAAAEYAAAAAGRPGYTWAYQNRGLVLHEKGAYDEALAAFGAAIEASPTFMPAWYSRAQTWMAKRQYDKAIADYSRALILDTEYVTAYVMRGHAYTWKDDWDRAIADYTHAITLDPKNASAYDARAGALALAPKKDYPGVIKDETQALELGLKGNLGAAYSRRANAHSALGNDAGALADYAESLKANPNDYGVCGKLAMLQEKKGDRAQALASYLKTADLAAAQKQPAQAISALNAALDLDPKQAAALARRAELEEGQGQLDKAAEDLAAALKVSPQNAEWKKRLAALKAKLGPASAR
jgi:tetratricopeptide (TPR) repeat protein